MRNIVKKIGILGDSGAGKRTLFKKTFYPSSDPDAGLNTIGTIVGKEKFNIKYDGDDVVLTLLAWDMTGQKKFDSVRPSYCQGTEGAVIVSRSDSEESMLTMGKYADKVYKAVGKVPISFVVNKVAGHWKEPGNRQLLERTVGADYNAEIYYLNFKRCKRETLKKPFEDLGVRLIEGCSRSTDPLHA